MGSLRTIQNLSTRLSGLADLARSTRAELEETQRIGSGTVASLEGIQTRAGEVLSSTRSSLASAHREVEAAAASITTRVDQVVAHSRKASEELEATSRKIRDQAEDLQTSTATRLDDLTAKLRGSQNLWDKAVVELADAVKLGAVPIEQLLSLYGNAMFEGQRLSEFLKGMDLHQYRDTLRDFIGDLRAGTVEIDDVLAFLSDKELVFAQQFKEVIELFRAGKVTLQRVAEVVGQIQKLFPDSDFAELAEAIEQAARKGQL